jgi:hypothetical protein
MKQIGCSIVVHLCGSILLAGRNLCTICCRVSGFQADRLEGLRDMTQETGTFEAPQEIPTDRREKIAWYLFDFANTSFTVLMVTALFPIFFRNLVTDVFVDGGVMGTALWGYAGSITMLVIALHHLYWERLQITRATRRSS